MDNVIDLGTRFAARISALQDNMNELGYGPPKPTAAILVGKGKVLTGAVETFDKHPLKAVIDTSATNVVGTVSYLTDPPCASCVDYATQNWVSQLLWPGGSLTLHESVLD